MSDYQPGSFDAWFVIGCGIFAGLLVLAANWYLPVVATLYPPR